MERKDPPNAAYLLWESLRQLGLERKGDIPIGVTNVVLCRPPENRDPNPEEVSACYDRLIHEIQQRQPKVILALGNFASRTLLRTRAGVAMLREQDFMFHGARLVCTYHPAAIFRMGGLFTDLSFDLERVIRLIKSDDISIRAPKIRYAVVSTLDQLRALVARVKSPFSCDTENGEGGKVIACGIGWKEGEDTYVGVISEEVMEDQQARFLLNRLFQGRQIYHQSLHDVVDLHREGISNARIEDDTMLMSYAIDERRGTHGLEILAKTYDDAPNWKQIFISPYIKKRSSSYAAVPRDRLYQYNAFDAYYTRRLYDILWDNMDNTLRNLYRDLMMPAQASLYLMQQRGIRLDLHYASQLDAEYARRMEELQERIGDCNPNSPQQVKVLMSKRGYNVGSTGREILESLPDPVAQDVVRYRHARKMRSTYIEGFVGQVDSQQRVHPQYKQHDTATGRLSATDPPIQTVPRAKTERDLFVAAPGYKFIYADYVAHEFRVIAYLSKDPWLQYEVFNKHRDLHAEAAKTFLANARIPEGFDSRTIAKMINFGLLYGRESWSLSQQINTPQQEAQSMIDAFFQRMPLVKKFMQEQRRKVLEDGMIETVFGRRRRFGLITRENVKDAIKQGYNYPVQSTASDIALSALIELNKRLDPRVAFPVTILHDGIVIEVLAALAVEVAYQTQDIMSRMPQQCLPGLDFAWDVDLKIGDRWGSLEKLPPRSDSVAAQAL